MEGYHAGDPNRVTVDWASVPPLVLVPVNIPAEVEMKAAERRNNQGRPSLSGPGKAG